MMVDFQMVEQEIHLRQVHRKETLEQIIQVQVILVVVEVELHK